MRVQIGERVIIVPQGVEVRVIDDKPKFKVGDYVSYNGGVFRITAFTSTGYCVDQIHPTETEPKAVWVEFSFTREPELTELPDYEEIIDAWGDAHDADLRKKINDAWNKNRAGFCPILRALYARDIDEITDHDSFMYEEWKDTSEYRHGLTTGDWEAYNTMALKHMEREWADFADNYLNHIADDCDLECILNFLHYPYLPIYQD